MRGSWLFCLPNQAGPLAVEFALLARIVTPASVIVAGVLFGLGYAVIFPAATNWAARLYPAATARPIAMTTSGFHAGSLLATLLAGFALAHTHFPVVLGMLAGAAFAVGVSRFVHLLG